MGGMEILLDVEKWSQLVIICSYIFLFFLSLFSTLSVSVLLSPYLFISLDGNGRDGDYPGRGEDGSAGQPELQPRTEGMNRQKLPVL